MVVSYFSRIADISDRKQAISSRSVAMSAFEAASAANAPGRQGAKAKKSKQKTTVIYFTLFSRHGLNRRQDAGGLRWFRNRGISSRREGHAADMAEGRPEDGETQERPQGDGQS
ncbi:MAG TPA: hypothetical protein PLP29_02605 [Candidatus Ozemobacteraceae bacterium]|nr:hypothetical protein [Candidatus Ozemobacteraceae bacterium]